MYYSVPVKEVDSVQTQNVTNNSVAIYYNSLQSKKTECVVPDF